METLDTCEPVWGQNPLTLLSDLIPPNPKMFWEHLIQ